MIYTPNQLTETTDMPLALEPLDDALEDLRITGTVLLHETYLAPWAIRISGESRLREVLHHGADVRVLLFHFVRHGAFEIRTDGGDAMTVDTADLVICPAGVAHSMSCGTGATAVPIEDVLQGQRPGRGPVDEGDATALVCGVFLARAAPLNPLLGALPSVIKVATADASFSPMLAGVAWMLAHELDRGALGGFSSARLLELLCAEAIRTYQRTQGSRQPGWFRGLADARIGEAIRRVHQSPAADWTVDSLAARAALSPSRFAARFREATGQSVMNYVARWRANLACRLLQDSDLTISQIAGRVGYDSLPAFSRAFKAHLGEPPATWRAARAAAVGARLG